MNRIAIIAALTLAATGTAHAGAIAEAASVDAGYEVRLQLSDAKSDASVPCKFGKLSARILTARVGDPNSTVRTSVGCWVVNRDGSVEYSSMNERTGQFDYAKVDASNFKKLAGFTEWGAYMGPFMLSDAASSVTGSR
uniref:DUF2141 domain-containing protein n=1 Tax=Pseudomonas phage Touem01 TaxID=3138548 RepID=A0AAU6W2X9_9VIRU